MHVHISVFLCVYTLWEVNIDPRRSCVCIYRERERGNRFGCTTPPPNGMAPPRREISHLHAICSISEQQPPLATYWQDFRSAYFLQNTSVLPRYYLNNVYIPTCIPA